MVARVVIANAALAGGIGWLATNATAVYGYALFLALPLLIGFVPVAILALRRPRPFWYCAAVGFLVAFIASLGFLFIGWEGLICIGMALPITSPLILFGITIAYLLFHAKRLPGAGSSAILMVAVVTVLVSCEGTRPRTPRMNVVADSLVVAATAEETWRTIVNLDELRPPKDDLLFRAGLACPQKTKIVGAHTGGVRVCTLSTGVLVEDIDAWEPNRRLAWRARNTPPPLTELNPIAEVDAAHLHGYYRSVRGEFVLDPLPGGRTLLTRRTWYTHDLYPAAYWRMWCDMAASKIHRYVLEEVRFAAENRPAGARV